jgi:hypothetical protein
MGSKHITMDQKSYLRIHPESIFEIYFNPSDPCKIKS